MDTVYPPTLIDFLTIHPHLQHIEIITDEYDNFQAEEEFVFPELDHLTAPLPYWHLVRGTPTLRYAGIHQARFTEFAAIRGAVNKFTEIQRVKIVIPASKLLLYLIILYQELPNLQELSFDFAIWKDHGDVTVSLPGFPQISHLLAAPGTDYREYLSDTC